MSAPIDADARSSQAVALLNEGTELLGAGKARKAVKTLDRAFRLLTEAPAEAPAEAALCRRIGAALLRALREGGRESDIERRGQELILAGVPDERLADRVITHLAFEEKRTDHEALSVYVSAIESGVTLSRAVRERLNQVLAFSLHIRLTSKIDEVKGYVPLLERLHRSRPRLTFARLYLGRFHYLQRDFATARTYLMGIEGRLASSPKILNVRARCAEKLGLVDEALATYRAALEKDFHQPHVHFRIGRLLLQKFREDRDSDSDADIG